MVSPTGRSGGQEDRRAGDGTEARYGGGRIRTSEGGANRFTAGPLWPLGNSPGNRSQDIGWFRGGCARRNRCGRPASRGRTHVGRTMWAGALLAQPVEHLHGKEGVGGSSPPEGLFLGLGFPHTAASRRAGEGTPGVHAPHGKQFPMARAGIPWAFLFAASVNNRAAARAPRASRADPGSSLLDPRAPHLPLGLIREVGPWNALAAFPI